MVWEEDELDELFNKSLLDKRVNPALSVKSRIKMPPYGKYLTVNVYNPPIIPNEVYCPICKKSYPLTSEYFTFRLKEVFGLKKTDYVVCKACRRRSMSNDYKAGLRWVSLDPCFGLKLRTEELALAFSSIAEGSTKNNIADILASAREDHMPVQKKTMRNGIYRMAPIIREYMTDCCRPRIVDEMLVIDTTHFTHHEPVQDDHYVTRYKRIEHYVTALIGKYSTLIYGYGVAISKLESARQCVAMANKYTSEMLSLCKIKLDEDKDTKKALIEAMVPEENLTLTPKKDYKGCINEIEGFFSKVKEKIKKHRLRKKPSIFACTTAFFANWNLYKQHDLFDGRWHGTLAELLHVTRPPNWQELLNMSWRYILTKENLFEKFYPKNNRGPANKKGK